MEESEEGWRAVPADLVFMGAGRVLGRSGPAGVRGMCLWGGIRRSLKIPTWSEEPVTGREGPGRGGTPYLYHDNSCRHSTWESK